jgi:hypothetical protein
MVRGCRRKRHGPSHTTDQLSNLAKGNIVGLYDRQFTVRIICFANMQILISDNLILSQSTLITAAMTIGCKRDAISQIHRPTHRTFNLILAPTACHNQIGHTARVQLGFEVCLIKSIAAEFIDHDITRSWGRLGPDLPTRGSPCLTVARRTAISNAKNRNLAGAGVALQCDDTVTRIIKALM